MIMVKAGAPVDAVINQLVPLLEKGDVIIDGGNSLFTDTQRRCKELEAKGIHFVGCGVSGGEEGALKGPSLMPGGPEKSWEIVAPIFTKIAAQVDGEPCCRYMGPDGAGHYVKMVHNGIEYGDMQLICEAYAILKDLLGLEAPELAEDFHGMEPRGTEQLPHRDHLAHFQEDRPRYRQADGRCDPGQGGAERHGHVDAAIGHQPVRGYLDHQRGRRGAGDFLAQSRPRGGVEDPAAADARKPYAGDRQKLIDAVRDALYASKIVSYAQGMELLGAASAAYGWHLKFGDIATIWRGGCIIRAQFLEPDQGGIRAQPGPEEPAARPVLPRRGGEDGDELAVRRLAGRRGRSARAGVQRVARRISTVTGPPRLSSNLLQAQRDFFGAHTYERVDKPGVFHTEWLE